MISTANFHEPAPCQRPWQFARVGIVFTLFSSRSMAAAKVIQWHPPPMITNIPANPAVTPIIGTPMPRRFIAVMIMNIEDGRDLSVISKRRPAHGIEGV
jgi:hypothetical protein